MILFFLPLSALGDEPEVKSIRIYTSSNYLNLRFNLSRSLNPTIKKAIESGVTVRFSYYITLAQEQSWRKDRVLSRVILSKTIKYDNLKNEYHIATAINNGEINISRITLSTVEETKKNLTELEIPSVYPLWKLERNRTYYFAIKADAEGQKPPPYIRYLLFFISGKYFETEEKIEKFRF